MSRELIERLRRSARTLHAAGRPAAAERCEEAATLLEQQAAEIERLRAEGAKLRTVMIAAAEEIHAHWDAHCDAEGYGPANLQRRLEDGIPSEYGYTAGAFAELKAEREALRKDAERLRILAARAVLHRGPCSYFDDGKTCDCGAIDAAMSTREGA
jgi:hypothetical protein